MDDVLEGSHDSHHSSFSDNYQEGLHLEPIYETFICPLTKKVMEDPVTLENGRTFERGAVEKWFSELKSSGKKAICPLTMQELKSTELSPSLALQCTIEEWRKRNEASQLDFALRSLSPGNLESNILLALQYINNMCSRGKSLKHIVLKQGVIPMVAVLLKNSSSDVRCTALKTLRIIVEDEDEFKEAVAVGETIRTAVKFLAQDLFSEREEAIFLLDELSKSVSLAEKIGSVGGSILILVGLASSNSEDILTVQKAENILKNLEVCQKNVLQMAENGRMQPLLRLLLEGSPETQLAMISFLGDLVLSNDVKVLVARTAGSSLVNVMKSGNKQAREASLKALNEISSCEVSARILIEAGILPPLVRDLFAVGNNQLPVRLKEVSATILANVVASSVDLELVPLDPDHQTLVSEDIVHNLLHLISNTGPAVECKLLQVLIGLTTSPATVQKIVTAIQSSGATISLVQFIEAPQRELRIASIKLLHNISPYMSNELAEGLCSTAGQLNSLISILSEQVGISEEQAAVVGLLAELPERDLGLTQQLLKIGAFDIIICNLRRLQQKTTQIGRFVNPYTEGLVRILSRVTYVLEIEPLTIAFARENNLLTLFSDLLLWNGLDNVQMTSAMALENLAQQSNRLARTLEVPEPSFCCRMFPCFISQPAQTGVCPVHRCLCSNAENFCLVKGKVLEKLIACLDHGNENVVEAAMAALCTILDDGVDMEQSVSVLCEADGIRPILSLLIENRTQVLRRRAVWAIERILRIEDIAREISSDPMVGAALVDSFRNSDYRTRQIAEKALKLIDRLPNFSGIFPKETK